jgi:NAD(P)-dependent dehydrogenase (short-subunit alcohol dehydrogenase family)
VSSDSSVIIWGLLFELFYPWLASVEDFNRMYAVNTLGTFLCFKYAAKQMIEQGRGGRIIGASSLAGKQGKDSK